MRAGGVHGLLLRMGHLSIASPINSRSPGKAIALDLTLCVDAPDRHEAVVAEPAARNARLGPGNEVVAARGLSITTLTGRNGVLAGSEARQGHDRQGPFSACSLSSVGSQTILKSV